MAMRRSISTASRTTSGCFNAHRWNGWCWLWPASLIVIAILLGSLVHPYWYALTAFLAADLAQSSVTGCCPLAWLLRKAGVRYGTVFHD
jgi:hypothetical protein